MTPPELALDRDWLGDIKTRVPPQEFASSLQDELPES